jgi:predicted site-specific integrase-resolvase
MSNEGKEGKWVLNRKACEFYGVTGNTLRNWADNNKVRYKRNPSGNRVYWISSELSGTNQEKKGYIYARVSSSKQKDDLARQVEKSQSEYPNFEVVKDIASGLNYKRRGLLKLLEQSNRGLVSHVVVSSKDRLCRFGFELLEWQFLQNDTKLVVLENIDKTPEQEFTEDILAILQVFACRWNGKRRYNIENKKSTTEIDIIAKTKVKDME